MQYYRLERKKIELLTQQEFNQWLKLTLSNPSFHSPFFSPFFAKSVAKVNSNCWVTIIYKKGKIVGFFPFQFKNKVLGNAGRIGLYLSDYEGIVSEEDFNNQVIQEVLKASGIHQYLFNHLHPYQKKYGYCDEFIHVGYSIRLDEQDFESYWKSVSERHKNIVKNVERKYRKISREIDTPEFTYQSQNLEELDLLIKMKRNQYKETGAHDVFEEEWVRKCLKKLFLLQNDSFKGVLSKLSVKGKIISLHFGLWANDILHYWFPVYDPDFGKYSPGNLFLYSLLKNSEQIGIKSIDLGRGTQRYKREFGNCSYKLGVGTLRQNSIKAFIIRFSDFCRDFSQKTLHFSANG